MSPATGPRVVHPIEAESYRILRGLVDLSALGPLSRAVAERVIHASADPAWASDLVLDEHALAGGLAALRAGTPVVVDARMVAAAITSRPTLCVLDLAPPAADSPPDHEEPVGTTRSAAGVRAAFDQVGAGDRQRRRRQLDEAARHGEPRVERADPVGQGEQLDRAGRVLAAMPRHQQGGPVHAGSRW